MESREAGRGGQRREQILDTAMEMFGEVGYRGTSLRDIAARVGITHPGLLYHFHSKEELLQAVLARRDEISNETFALLDDSDPIGQVSRFLALIGANAARPGMIELYTTLAAEAAEPAHPAHEYFVARYRLLVEAFAATTQNAIDAGAVHPGAIPCPREFAIEILSLIEGLQLQWLYNRDLDIVRVLANRMNQALVQPIPLPATTVEADGTALSLAEQHLEDAAD